MVVINNALSNINIMIVFSHIGKLVREKNILKTYVVRKRSVERAFKSIYVDCK